MKKAISIIALLLAVLCVFSGCSSSPKAYPDKNIWCYTGYLFDEDICGKMLDQVPETRELLSYIDVLIDGPFIEERKNLKIRFRGSDNQRIIDVKKTMEAGEIVLWEEE